MDGLQHVYVVAATGGLRPETWAEVTAQHPGAQALIHDIGDDLSYGKALRQLWRLPGDLVIVEGDVIPPAGGIPEMFNCPEPWCTHRHWVGDHYQEDSLGLVRFAQGLRANFPALADRALGKYDPAIAARLGLTRVDPASIRRGTARGLRQAAIRQGAENLWPDSNPAAWPTTAFYFGCDVKLYTMLRHLGLTPHLHEPPTIHLREYSAVPDRLGRTGRPDPRLEAWRAARGA